jgi:hypothetical protein
MGVNEPGVVVPRTLVASQAQGWISLFSATRLCNDDFAAQHPRYYDGRLVSTYIAAYSTVHVESTSP